MTTTLLRSFVVQLSDGYEGTCDVKKDRSCRAAEPLHARRTYLAHVLHFCDDLPPTEVSAPLVIEMCT
ncbi:hypothetical protein MPTK1_5g01980 [Marchantia polymorpha subsp. ruderalis]|uniref:Uncharacterized protein n=2 Tax=Marchantia polymorpha TaxID=3197 RepID=A0AAF6BDZ2_MARPO|nr:hypothetical protein MARPO_0161s0006 [Marchantia polymorpha]BBN10226.1 hypothetical protein Mp_5g01980 [Marchantia polymorpha subsp. ruderalis]|eukprot:PTQ28501.1 hypothetical protein MARPO_0161s0006 [Marchantia polymorpha]